MKVKAKRGTRKTHPIFSPEDSDLESKAWRLNCQGYARTTENRKPLSPVSHFAHHLVCERVFGRRPDWSKREVVDHINRNPLDNRRENLRICSMKENSLNSVSTKHHKTQVYGAKYDFPYATKHACGKWQAAATIGGRQKYIGLFDDRREASNAALEAIKKEEAADV